ncbi:hypothetical protein [Adhaeribacter pallidiroseus]|uniref:Uncharacterized protein n=1 Tax=Adhaeribacter pallidiroseus TaxID=2072847 RepID=A0A369QRV0_9BACT|nr:hypothetical protein [Adhaeribacter pallidiroseus]RDC65967.1 hypothetical protein AHMF7616_04598 [Adhaeribacter pallidiroseus]
MEKLRVEILNPKALKILKNLADLNLITIDTKASNSFTEVLEKLRSKANHAPSLEDITKEVELVRRKRYGQ